jgi:hypothetical protein
VVTACFMALLAALVLLGVVIKKLSQRAEEVTMNKSSMVVSAVGAFFEMGWAIGASCAANAVPV